VVVPVAERAVPVGPAVRDPGPEPAKVLVRARAKGLAQAKGKPGNGKGRKVPRPGRPA